MGLFSKGSSSAPAPVSTTTQTTSSEPPAFQVPFIKKGLEAAERDILGRPQQFFPGSTVTPFSPQTEAALTETERLALLGSPNIEAAQDLAAQNIRGDFLLRGNPFLQEAVKSATRPMTETYQQDVVPGIDAQFSSQGRYGSGLHNLARQRAGLDFADRVGDVGSRLAYQNYANERARQEAAAAAAANLYQAGFTPAQQLAGVGAAREGLSDAQLQDAIMRFNFAQQEPGIRAREYGALAGLGGALGGRQVAQTLTPVQRGNPLLTGLGAASLGAGIASNLWGPLGAFS